MWEPRRPMGYGHTLVEALSLCLFGPDKADVVIVRAGALALGNALMKPALGEKSAPALQLGCLDRRLQETCGSDEV